MTYSSSSDEDNAAAPVNINNSQTAYFDNDDVVDITSTFQKRRLEWEQRKRERERVMQRQRDRRERQKNNNNDNEEESNDDDDSADLLAAESPLASPSPPQSPLYCNNNGRVGRSSKDNRNNNKVASKTTMMKRTSRSPSAALRTNRRPRSNDDFSPSPNRVAFAATATTMKKDNQSHLLRNANNNNTTTAAAAMSAKMKPTWDSSDSDNNGNNLMMMPKSQLVSSKPQEQQSYSRSNKSKKTAPLNKKKLIGIDSSSDDDDDDSFEKMKLKLKQMKEQQQQQQQSKLNYTAATGAATKRIMAPPISAAAANKSLPTTGPSSPFQQQQYKQRRKKGKLAHFQESSSDEDNANLVDDMSAKLQAKKQAERDARYNRRNPIHVEKRRQEEFEEQQQQQQQLQQQVENIGNNPMVKTHAGAGGLEGTMILVDGADQKSVSDMGEDNRRRGGGRVTNSAGASPNIGGGGGVWKQSRRYDSPGSNFLSNKKQRVVIDSDEDGLWDDMDDDVKKGDDDDGGSDDDKNKKRRGRGRGRPKGGAGGKQKATTADAATTQQPRKQQRGRGAPKIAEYDDERSLAPVKSKQAKTTKDAASKKQNVSRFASLLQDSDDDTNDGGKNSVSEQDKEDMLRDLKPEFANPKLGPPSALVPFLLSKTWKPGDPITHQENDGNGKSDGDDNDVDQVPASINRYLFPYQREGVQFMYKSVIHGKGCVLGDDMGLGKTVQMVSLIAALQKKTGTALDKQNIQSHRKKALQIVKSREENDRQALLSGMCSRINNKTILDEVGLPEFAPILIIVPSSVAENWASEFATWGHFNVAPIYQGSSREKALDRIKTGLDFILIVGKSIFSRADDFDALNSIKWKLVIVDEYHEYKNHQSVAHMRLADLRDNSNCPVIGMTGTLMQNNHKELYYLIDMVRPTLFGDWTTFRLEFSDPLKYARAKDAKAECVALGKDKQQVLERMLKPVYLVRKKDDVLQNQLTKKNEKVIFCQLSELQKMIYRHILTLPDYDLLRFANSPCECGVNTQYFISYKKLKTKKEQVAYQRRHKDQLVPKKKCCFRYPMNPYRVEEGGPDIDRDAVLWKQLHDKPIGDPNSVAEDILDGKYIACKLCPTCVQLPALNKLMKICSHPSLLQVPHSETGESKRKKLEFAEIALPPDIRSKLPGGTLYQYESLTNDHVKLSGKMKTLDYLLKKFQRQQHRVLVFSHSTATLDIIQNHCRISGWEHLRLDGKTPSSSRQGLVDKFQKNDDIFLFLISTKAGGLGLNLTAANKVIIFDVNWNPSYDEQAQDRSFRIGQKKDVEVTRLVARGTIEELIYQRQVYKVQLKKQTLEATELGEDQPQIFRGVDKDKNRKGELFGIENLLKFKDGSFMSSLWKKSDNPLEPIALDAVQAELDKRTEDDLDELAERDDELGQAKTQNDESGNETSDNEYEGIDHGDYFNKQRGRARVAQGDDAFDEEMGGVSQMIAATTAMAVQNLYSSDDDASYEGEDDGADAKPDVKLDNKPNFKSDVQVQPYSKSNSIQEVASRADDSVATETGEEKIGEGNNTSALQNSDSESEEKKDSGEKSNQVNDIMSPEPSTGTQSLGSLDGLRTQHEPTPKLLFKKKATAPAKYSLMGVSFDKTPKKKESEKKKPSGLYIPKY